MRTVKSIFIGILLLFMIVSQSEAAGMFWPHGQLKWTLEKAGKLTAEPTLAPNGLLYCPVGSKIVAYDTANGKKLWERSTGIKITEPLLVTNQDIYVAGTDGFQQMRPNGSLNWIYKLYPKPSGSKVGGVITRGPGELIFFGLADGLYALEPGKNYQWRYSDDKNVAALLGDQERVYVCLGDKQSGYILRALDQAGNRLWYLNLGDIKDIQMVFGPNGNFYVVTNPANLDKNSSGKIIALNRETGKEKWRYSVNANDISKVGFSTEETLFFTSKNRINSIDLSSGKLNWELSLLNVVSGVAVDESKRRIYAGSSDGRLFCISYSGKMLWEKIPDKTIPPTLHKDGGIMVYQKDKSDKDTFTMAPFLLPDGGILIYSDKGTMYKIMDVHKENG